MWIASKIGFFSIVQKDRYFHVRARVRGDLENILKATGLVVEIERWPAADYRWRIRLGNCALLDVFHALAGTINYPNFKSEIHATPDQVEKLGAYSDLWASLHRLQRVAEAGLQDDFRSLAGARKSSQTFANMPSQGSKVPKSAASQKNRRK